MGSSAWPSPIPSIWHKKLQGLQTGSKLTFQRQAPAYRGGNFLGHLWISFPLKSSHRDRTKDGHENKCRTESFHSNIDGKGITLPPLVPASRIFQHPWKKPVVTDRTVWPLTPYYKSVTISKSYLHCNSFLRMTEGPVSSVGQESKPFWGPWDGKAIEEHEKNYLWLLRWTGLALKSSGCSRSHLSHLFWGSIEVIIF